MKPKIGILGSGVVSKALAQGFVRHGYEVMAGSRDISKLETFPSQIKKGSFAETAEWAQIIVLACKGTAALDVIEIAGRKNFAGKTVIDTTNPIADAPPENGVIKFFTDLNESLMERIQKFIPDANVVKCFSVVGNAFMVDPDFPDGKPTMFICGNNSDAKKDTEAILRDFGWEWEDLGKVTAARAIEPLCMLWCIPGFVSNSWTHAFKLLKK